MSDIVTVSPRYPRYAPSDISTISLQYRRTPGSSVRSLPLWAVLLCLLLPGLTSATTSFTGRVVALSDGDTVTVFREGKAVKVRLYGVDTPEKKQAFGTQARQFTSALAFQQIVTVIVRGTEWRGRLLGEVLLPDGRNLNQELVRAGMAWWYVAYAPKDTTLAALEIEARTARRGLWADTQPVAPWEWRKEQRLRAACAKLRKAA